MYDPRRLVIAYRRRPPAAAEEARDLGGVLDQMPGLVTHIHFYQHVARKKLALRAHFGAALDLDDLLCRHEDLLELVGKTLLFGLLTDRGRDLLLEAGVDVNHIPAARHFAASRN